MVEMKHKTFGSVGQERAVPAPQSASDLLTAASQASPQGQKQQELPQQQQQQKIVTPLPERAAAAPTQNIAPLDLQSLIELGRVQDTLTLGQFTFELATLGDSMQAKAYEIIQNMESTDGFLAVRRVVIALSLVSINGQLPESLVGGDGDPIEKRISLVASLQGNVVEKLYDFYDELLERGQQEITPEQVKN